MIGECDSIWEAQSFSKKLRERGGGGVITTLLVYALERGLIQQALVMKSSKLEPWAEPIIATTTDEVIEAAGSKYCFVPYGSLVNKLCDDSAIVGLPCQIRAHKDSGILKLGLFCGLCISAGGRAYLIKKLGINKEDIDELDYRAPGGGLSIKLKNGETLNYCGYSWLAYFFPLKKCLYCTDNTNHYSDISVGDRRPEWSNVIIRTQRGRNLFKRAVEEGYLRANLLTEKEFLARTMSPLIQKEVKGGYIHTKLVRARGKWIEFMPLNVLRSLGGLIYKYTKNQIFFNSTLSQKDIFLSLTALDDWRRKYNKENLGFGYDQYKPDQKFHYPEAYALWGNGYLKLYQITQREEYLALAKKCAKWLIENKNPNYENFSWGLPWDWEQRRAPKELSYLITTIFAGDFLITLYNFTRIKQFLNIVESIAQWILKENGAVTEENGTRFYYANHASLMFPVINPTSKASGFFSKLYLTTRKEDYKNISIESARYVINRQNPDGSWYYGSETNYIDNVHTGFTIEGLCDVYFTLPSMRKKLEKVLIDSYYSYWNKLYTTKGFGNESLYNSLFTQIKGFFLNYNTETRLWGYASGIRAFTKLSKILLIQNKGLIIVKYLIDNLQAESGAFRFKSKEDNYYIRHEAHIFDALATLILEVPFV